MTNLIERIKSVAGQDFDSYGCRVRNPHITARQSIEIADYIVELEQERDKLAAQVERLRKLIMDKTAQPECCHRPDGDPETGPICCGSPDFTWPDDVVAVLSETKPAALEALKAQWQADILESTSIQIAAHDWFHKGETPIQIATSLLEESKRIRQRVQGTNYE